MIKVFTIAHLPQELTQAWLQHLRNFDTAHPGCHFEVVAVDPSRDIEDAARALSEIDPPFPFHAIFTQKKGAP